MTIGFDSTEPNKKGYSEYIDKYIVVNTSNNSTYLGRLDFINGTMITLNPFSGGDYDPEKGFIRRLVSEDQKISLHVITAITPISIESLEAHCVYQSKQDIMEREMKELQYEQAKLSRNQTNILREELYLDGAGI